MPGLAGTAHDQRIDHALPLWVHYDSEGILEQKILLSGVVAIMSATGIFA